MTPAARESVPGRRTGAAALVASGLLFALFPLLRPWSDTFGTRDGLAQAFASPWWVVAHLAGGAAFIMLCLGAVAARDVHLRASTAAVARASLPLLWAGAGLTLFYFGAESFALPAIVADGSTVLETAEAIRSGPVQILVFGVGLLLMAAGMMSLAVAIWRGGVLPPLSAVLLAAAIMSYLPQFFMPPAGRIIHGLLAAAGAFVLAGALWRSARRSPRRDSTAAAFGGHD